MDNFTMDSGTQQPNAYEIFRNKADKYLSEVTSSWSYHRQGGVQMFFPGSFQLCCTITEENFVRMQVWAHVFSGVKWKYFTN